MKTLKELRERLDKIPGMKERIEEETLNLADMARIEELLDAHEELQKLKQRVIQLELAQVNNPVHTFLEKLRLRPQNAAPVWPHDQAPPPNQDIRPLPYVAEMTSLGVLHNTDPDAVIAAIKEGLTPAQFIKRISNGQTGQTTPDPDRS